ncbi:MAG: membrane dipeptidase, partial [Cetobacterium sp.]
ILSYICIQDVSQISVLMNKFSTSFKVGAGYIVLTLILFISLRYIYKEMHVLFEEAGIEKNIQDIEKLYELGIRHGNLTWNEENELGTGVKGNSERGITEKGRKLLKKMEDLGMIIDVSHANEKSFWDILESTKTPIIASHSNAQTLCNVARNLSDEQLRAIAKRRGVVGINSYKNFIDVSEENQTLERLVDHIDYMVKIMGIDYVGLGFDFGEYFDPDGKLYGPKGLEKPEEAKNILNVLGSRGYSKEDIEKIAFKNFFRVIKEILN